jgi:hypothetical protein
MPGKGEKRNEAVVKISRYSKNLVRKADISELSCGCGKIQRHLYILRKILSL